MRVHGLPIRHANPEVDLLHGYVESAVAALTSRGINVERCWLDPMGPRDATIVFRAGADLRGAVWNEWTGWQSGLFEGGRQGRRTVLGEATTLGGRILMNPFELAEHIVGGTSTRPLESRGPETTRDGLDDTLYSWNLKTA